MERTVYGDVTKALTENIPFLDADELLCKTGTARSTMLSCSPAGKVQPKIAPGEKVLVTYKRYRLKPGGPPGALWLTSDQAVALERG